MKKPTLTLALLLSSCGTSATYDPGVMPEQIRAGVTHRLFPLPVGARWTLSGTVADGFERIEVQVLGESKTVGWGAPATVVEDIAYIDDVKVEATRDWYGQHTDGSVWYLGEDTSTIEDGVVTDHAGAWEAGIDGALPGVQIPSAPSIGQKYRQEYAEGVAEDFGEVVALDAAVTVPAGSWTGCLKTRDTSAIDPTLDEYKYYCPGMGLVLVEEGTFRIELVAYSGL